MRSLTTALIAAKNLLANPNAWVMLVEVSINPATTLYYARNASPITFNSITYASFPMTMSDMAFDSKGSLTELKVSLSNVLRTVSAYIEANDIRGRRVLLMYVESGNLSDPNATAFKLYFAITGVEVTEQAVVLTLGHERLMAQTFPGRRYLQFNCTHVYKDPTSCAYVGSIPSCSKMLEGSNGCRAHANVANFGGFPGIATVLQ